MRASIVILAGLGIGLAVSLSGCETYGHHRADYGYTDPRNQQEKAQECVAAFEPNGKAPQVMTYDSDTGTEVHMNTEGKRVDVTAQNNRNDTSLGMGGKVGGGIPEACTDADPRVGPAIPRSTHNKNAYNGYH